MCDTHPFARLLAINVGVSADCVLFILTMPLTPEQNYLGLEALKCLTLSGNILTINVLARNFYCDVECAYAFLSLFLLNYGSYVVKGYKKSVMIGYANIGLNAWDLLAYSTFE